MDWKIYIVIFFMLLIGAVNNWGGLKEGFREMYNKRRKKKEDKIV